jgi:hypothetical protein
MHMYTDLVNSPFYEFSMFLYIYWNVYLQIFYIYLLLHLLNYKFAEFYCFAVPVLNLVLWLSELFKLGKSSFMCS